MTTDKAIELLEWCIETGGRRDNDAIVEAQKLGIEALKRLELLRICLGDLAAEKLPGETEE